MSDTASPPPAPPEPPAPTPATEPLKERPLTVAVIAEPRLAGPAACRALLESGLRVKVLCPDEAAERVLDGLRPAAEGAPEMAIVRGAVEAQEDLERLMDGADGVAFLSPVGLEGRVWRARSHLEDLDRILRTAERKGLARIVYLSSLAAGEGSGAACLKEAEEGEKRIAASTLKDFALRAGPLMGPGDGLVSRAQETAESGALLMCVWGYGDTVFQPIHAADLGRCVARCFVPAPVDPKPGVYAVAGIDTLSLLDLFDRALERRHRFKIKLHIPLFVLRLLALGKGKSSEAKGGSFRERVRLLTAPFYTDRNDVPKLLGPKPLLKTLAETIGA